MNESCHTYEWVMSHIWISHVPHMNESCPTYEWVMSSVKYAFLAIAIECHTYQCHTCFSSIPIAVRCPAGLGRTVHIDVSCPTYERVVPHISISHVQDINVSCHTCFPAICDKEGPIAVHCLAGLDRTVHVWHASFVRVTCLIHMCDLAHSYMWYDSIIWLSPCTVKSVHRTCELTMCESYLWIDYVWIMCVVCVQYMCELTMCEWYVE